jgi:hypothetical protein
VSISIFETRMMLAALEQIPKVRTFFLDTFFKQTNTSETEHIDIDIVKGKRRLAPFVNPRLQGKVIERRGYTTNSYKPAYVKPKMITTAEDMLKRLPGENIYSGNNTPAQRAALQLGKDLADLDEMITRREEWMAAQVLQTGKVEVVGDGVDDEVDFQMAAAHLVTLSGADLWSASTATIIEDLEDMQELIAQDSGIMPDVCVMGKLAARAMSNHEATQKKFNMLKVDYGIIKPTLLPNGVKYWGYCPDLAMDIYSYYDWYYDEASGTEKPLMNEKKVLLGSTQARCIRQYGAIRDLASLAAVPRFPKSWTENDPSQRMVMVQSAPLPSLHQVDAFGVLKVIALSVGGLIKRNLRFSFNLFKGVCKCQ